MNLKYYNWQESISRLYFKDLSPGLCAKALPREQGKHAVSIESLK